MISPITLGRLAGLAGLLALAMPLQLLAVRFGWRLAGRLPVRFHRVFLRLFSIRLTTCGIAPEPGTPTLILANHISWLDIPVLGSLMPLSFVAKSEIAGWPVVGFLAKLQRCIFLDRSRRGATAETNAEMAARLSSGDAILLFPEGTTGDGLRVLPFRSSLVGAARAALADPSLSAIRLQPLALVYTHVGGLPVTRRDLPDIAWYGDMELGPHLKTFLRGGPFDVCVVWGEPIEFGDGTDRKRATALARTTIGDAIGSIRSGTGSVHASLEDGKVVRPGMATDRTPRLQRA